MCMQQLTANHMLKMAKTMTTRLTMMMMALMMTTTMTAMMAKTRRFTCQAVVPLTSSTRPLTTAGGLPQLT